MTHPDCRQPTACFLLLLRLLLPPAASDVPLDAPDIPCDHWNIGSESYSFTYLSEDPTAAAAAAAAVIKLLVKVVVIGDSSLVACFATDASNVQPQTLELTLGDYVSQGESSSGSEAGTASQPLDTKSYKNLEQLASKISKALAELTAAAVGSSGDRTKQSVAPATAVSEQQQRQQQQEHELCEGPGQGSRPTQPQQPLNPLHDPLRIGPPRRPLRMGESRTQACCCEAIGGVHSCCCCLLFGAVSCTAVM